MNKLLSLLLVSTIIQITIPYHIKLVKTYDSTPTKIEIVASYTITGQVLDIQNKNDSFSFISPLDITIGLGDINTSTSYVSQNGRIATIQYLGDKDRYYVITHFTNNHIIPLNINVANQLEKIKYGDVITLTGQLVNVNYKLNNVEYNVRTSLVRDDYIGINDGGCEIILVSEVKVW